MSGQPGLWQQLRQDSRDMNLSNRLGSIGRTWFVFPDGKGPRGSFTSMSTLLTSDLVRSRDIIILGGVLKEQCVAPLNVYDVSIIGAANNPRQATSGGVATGGGASWIAPASPTASTPLLELRAAGWSISNIQFTPTTSSACVRLTRSASVDTTDASHASFSGCAFQANGATTPIGIEDNGGCGFVTIDNCEFESLTTAIKGLNTAAAVPLRWRVRNNNFWRNTNAIGMSSSQGLFQWNRFDQAANDTNFKVNLIAVSAQGDLNQVLDNQFSDAAANVTIAKGYKPGTTDVWRNWVTDSASMVVTVPA
jgi:hypothetical protein